VRPDGRRRRRYLAAVALGLLTVACGDGDEGGNRTDRQAEVAERGAEVMPFDLDATTHRFEPTGTGLVQTVVSDDPADAEQVGLIRGHLADEAERFRQGDYRDPAAIHGDDMPGLAELEAGAERVTVTLHEVADGARLTFASDDPDLVDALHRWGEAQTTDHGSHAEHPGSGG
jgi:hypothetical protein